MPWNPITDYGSELANLQAKTSIFPRGNAKGIFIEPDLGTVVARIEPPVKSRLRKKINMRPNLCIEKERQARIEKVVDIAIDETGRRLLEIIIFDIDGAA